VSSLTVAAAMRPKVISCTLRTPVMEVARRLQEEGVRFIVVASSGSDLIAGLVGELDLLRAVVNGQTEGMASDIMSLDSVPSIGMHDSLDSAVERMRDEKVSMFVVTGGEPPRPFGMLSIADVAAFMAGPAR
jgi:CBS domain-containing protein